MNFVLRTIVVDSDEATREELKAALSGLDIVWVEAEYSHYDDVPQQLGAVPPDVMLIGLDSDPGKGLEVIAQVAQRCPTCGICAVSRSRDGQLILQAIRAGAKEFLNLPIQVDELVTMLKTLGGAGNKGNRLRGCTMIAVAGSTGGVGTTSVAVNLATILANSPERSVVLVDLDLVLGDADVFLDALHDYTLADLTQNAARLDFDLLRRSLARHKSGLYLLPRPVELEDAALVTENSLRRVFSLLKASFSHIVVDLSKAYNRLDMTALECCNILLLVSQLDLASLRNVVRLLKSFRSIEGLDQKLKIVINRSTPDAGPIRLKKAQEIVGREFFWLLPNEYRLMVEVSNHGAPLIERAPRAEITQSLVAMSKALCGDELPRGHTPGTRSGSSASLSKWLGFLPTFGPKPKAKDKTPVGSA